MTNLVSIIVPCYNAEKFIAETIQSVINQTHKNWELIIIDDGSKDNSKQIVSTFLSDTRISYFFQENTGVSEARNNGVLIAKGDFYAFLDADDVWYENNLEEKIMFILNRKVDVVYSNYNQYNSSGQIINQSNKSYANQPSINDILLYKGNYSTAPSGIILKKEVLIKIGGFDPQLSNNADQDFWLRILANNFIILYIDKALWKYRIHDANMSSNIGLLEKDTIYLQKKTEEMKLYKSFWFKQNCLSRMYLMLAGSWWKDGNNKIKGVYFIILALISYPFSFFILFEKWQKKLLIF